MSLGNEWLERVLEQESPGGPPERLSVVVPSVVAPEKAFVVKLAALDVKGYPSVEADGVARLASGPWTAAGGELAFEGGRPAVGAFPQVSLPEEGLFRVACELDGATYLSNPVCCQRNPTARLYGLTLGHT